VERRQERRAKIAPVVTAIGNVFTEDGVLTDIVSLEVDKSYSSPIQPVLSAVCTFAMIVESRIQASRIAEYVLSCFSISVVSKENLHIVERLEMTPFVGEGFPRGEHNCMESVQPDSGPDRCSILIPPSSVTASSPFKFFKCEQSPFHSSPLYNAHGPFIHCVRPYTDFLMFPPIGDDQQFGNPFEIY
jgi:hypothetical protein